jgi:SAM-dependent methyltransferase
MIVIPILIEEEENLKVVFHPSTQFICSQDNDKSIHFKLHHVSQAYLSSKKRSNFSTPPKDNLFCLRPNTNYDISIELSLSDNVCQLWLIEYDDQERLCSHKFDLRSQKFHTTLRTHTFHKKLCIALRFNKNGKIKIFKFKIKKNKLSEVEFNHGENIRKFFDDCHTYSIFNDPVSYRPHNELTFDFFQDTSYFDYNEVASTFKGFTSILDVGSGPGSQLEALRKQDIGYVMGLERNKHFLGICREKNIPVVEHNLNDPFPFIPSERFEGVISQYAIDYLSPIAQRNLLKEIHRVLLPAGIFFLTAITNDNGTKHLFKLKDNTRKHIEALLEEANFNILETAVSKQRIRVLASRSNNRRHQEKAEYINLAKKTIQLNKECQISWKTVDDRLSSGCVVLVISDTTQKVVLEFKTDGSVYLDGVRILPSSIDFPHHAYNVRILKPWTSNALYSVQCWKEQELIFENQYDIGFKPTQLNTQFIADEGINAEQSIEFFDVWLPNILNQEGIGDAQMHFGSCRSKDPSMPDISIDKFKKDIKKYAINRALVSSYGSARMLDSFDQIPPIQITDCQIFPVIRIQFPNTLKKTDVKYIINQLEIQWQQAKLYGIKVDFSADEVPARRVLDWIESRQLITFWNIASVENLQWIEENILKNYSFSVLLSQLKDYPFNKNGLDFIISLLDKYPNAYLVTNKMLTDFELETAIKQAPHHILYGSDYPVAGQILGQNRIANLNVQNEYKKLVLSENIRFLTEKIETTRQILLDDKKIILFPKVPQTVHDLKEQGFLIIKSKDLEYDENKEAKEFWSSYKVLSWYRTYKPWAGYIKQIVADLQPSSVLEFGCNMGRNIGFLQKKFSDIRLSGIDINPKAIAIAKENPNLELYCGDEQTLFNFSEGEFDFVFTVSVLDHVANIDNVCNALMHCANKFICCIEVRLPIEGKVIKHFDHKLGYVTESTGASYSWHLEKYFATHQRIWRTEMRSCYLHDASLGPYYTTYMFFLEEVKKT